MSLQEQVTDNVRVLAAARGTTPTRAARSVGMSAERLHAKLQARVRWNVEDLELMAQALNVEPEQLVSAAWWPERVRTATESAAALTTVRPKGLEPPTFWTVVWALLTCVVSGSAQSREGWELAA